MTTPAVVPLMVALSNPGLPGSHCQVFIQKWRASTRTSNTDERDW